jgi:hypothetical protein
LQWNARWCFRRWLRWTAFSTCSFPSGLCVNLFFWHFKS